MLISDEKKFIFCHIPKNAGISICSSLKKFSANGKWKVGDSLGISSRFPPTTHLLSAHATMEELYSFTSNLFEGYYKFGVVRNSWDRLVSFYHYSGESHRRTFASFIDRTCEGIPQHNINRVRAQKCYLFGKDGNILVDKICSFDNLEKDFGVICEHLKLGDLQLGKKNSTIHKPYTDYYEKEPRLIEKVRTSYCEDIELFGFIYGGGRIR